MPLAALGNTMGPTTMHPHAMGKPLGHLGQPDCGHTLTLGEIHCLQYGEKLSKKRVVIGNDLYYIILARPWPPPPTSHRSIYYSMGRLWPPTTVMQPPIPAELQILVSCLQQ